MPEDGGWHDHRETMTRSAEAIFFDRLVSRHKDGIHVPHFDFESAEVGKCHDNVDRFVACYPDHACVRGWLLTEIGNADGSSSGFYRILCHSIVRRPNDDLIDVTPMDEQDRSAYLFLEQTGLDMKFEDMKVRFAEVYYPPIADLLGSTLHY